MNDSEQPPPGSVTNLMHEGSDEAYWALYTRFVINNEQLRERIRRQLPSDRVADPFDVVADAFRHVWDKAQAGAHRDFSSRSHLLALLTCYAKARARDAGKRPRPKGDSSVFSAASGLGAGAARQPLPSEAELRAAYEGIADRLAMLDSDEHREIALAAMSGMNQTEIAESLGLANVKRVERALTAIRSCWTEEYRQQFAESWQRGERPGFEEAFRRFPAGGKWLLGELVEVEIQQRLAHSLPVSLREFKSRAAGTDLESAVERVFSQQLCFTEPPDRQRLAQVLEAVDAQVAEVARSCLEGQSCEQISARISWPLSSVKDALKHVRQRLEPPSS